MTDTTTQLSWIAVDKATGEIITDSQTTRTVTMHQQIFEALATICKMLPERDANGAYQWRMMTRTERGMLNRASKELNQIKARKTTGAENAATRHCRPM